METLALKTKYCVFKPRQRDIEVAPSVYIRVSLSREVAWHFAETTLAVSRNLGFQYLYLAKERSLYLFQRHESYDGSETLKNVKSARI